MLDKTFRVQDSENGDTIGIRLYFDADRFVSGNLLFIGGDNDGYEQTTDISIDEIKELSDFLLENIESSKGCKDE